MTWQDALANLTGEVISNLDQGQSWQQFTAGPTPSSPWQNALNELTRASTPLHGILDAANPHYNITQPRDLIGAAVDTMAIPAHLVQSGIGAGSTALSSATQAIGLGNKDLIAAYHQGGGQGAWNYIVSKQPWYMQALLTIGSDPLTYTGLGVGEDAAKALAAAAEHAVNPGNALLLQGAAKGLEGLQAFNDAPGAALDLAKSRLAPRIPQSLIDAVKTPAGQPIVGKGKLLDLSARTRTQIEHERLYGLLEGDVLSRQHLAQLPPQPTLWGHQYALTPEALHPDLANAMATPSHSDAAVPMLQQLRATHQTLSDEQAIFKQAMTDPITGKELYPHDAPWQQRLNLARAYDAAHPPAEDRLGIEKILNRWKDNHHMDPLYGDPIRAAAGVETKAYGKTLGIDYQKGNLYDLLAAAWGEQALTSGKFHTTNMMNGVLQNAILGHLVPDPVSDFFRAYQRSAPGVYDPPSIMGVKNQLAGEARVNQWGATLPQEVFKQGISADVGANASSSAVGALIGKAPLPGAQQVGRQIGKIFVKNNRISQAIETWLRETPYASALDAHMQAAAPTIDAMIAQLPGNISTRITDLVSPATPVTPERIFNELVTNGAARGDAQHIAQEYAHQVNLAKAAGLQEMHKTQFSYYRTNLDDMFRRFVPFMYWQSRAFPTYTEAALRNPWLAVNYFRNMKATEEANNDPGLSAREKGMLNFFGTYQGFTTLLDPTAFWAVTNVFDAGQDYTPQGITPTGNVLNWMKNHGIGMFPWFDQMFNLIGTYGDTFEPDFFSIRQKALISAAVNTFRAFTGQEPAGAPVADAMGALRGDISSITSQFLGDWISQPVYQKAGGSQANVTAEKLIENRIISNHTDPQTGLVNITYRQLLDAMDPSSQDYKDAFKQVATAGLFQQLNNFIEPFRIKVKDSQTDVRNAVVSNITDQAKKAGVAPWQYKPTIADVEFAAGFKMLTGRDWTPGSYDDARLQQQLAGATPQARQFLLDEHDYNSISNDAMKTYQALQYGDDPRTASLTDAGRRDAARQWAEDTGNMAKINEIFDAQKIFRATHPEFDAFKTWQNGMNNLQVPLAVYRQQAMLVNPNAKKYFTDLQQQLNAQFSNPDERAKALDQRTTDVSAWLAITGQAVSMTDNVPVPKSPIQPAFDPTLFQNQPQPPDRTPPQWLQQAGVYWQHE